MEYYSGSIIFDCIFVLGIMLVLMWVIFEFIYDHEQPLILKAFIVFIVFLITLVFMSCVFTICSIFFTYCLDLKLLSGM